MAVIWNLGAGEIAAGVGGPILLAALLVGFLAFATYAIMQDGRCEPVQVCLNCADVVPGGGSGFEAEPCEGPVEPPPA